MVFSPWIKVAHFYLKVFDISQNTQREEGFIIVAIKLESQHNGKMSPV